MADFSLDQVNTVATQLGVSPDYVREQLRYEGHNVLEPPAPAAPSPQAPQGMNVFGAYDTEPDAQAPTGTGSPDDFAATLNQQSRAAVSSMGAQPAPEHLRSRLTPVQRAEPAPAGQRRGVRAQGLARQQIQPGTGEAAPNYGRARKLLDAHERQLASEAQAAEQQFVQGAERLTALDEQRMGFAQRKADIESAYAGQRAAVADQIGQSQAQAAQNEATARQKEAEVLAAREAKLEQGRKDLVAMKVRGPGIGARLSNALAVALAQYGDAISATGGVDTNYAQATQQIVNDAIDRGIGEQLRAIDEKRGALTAEEQGIVNLRQQFGNDAAFRDYMRSAEREALVARLDTLAAQSDNETTKLAAQALSTDWKAQAETEAQAGRGAALTEAQKRLRDAADQRFGFELGVAMPKGGDAKKAQPGAGGLFATGEATPEDRKKAQEIASKFGGVVSTLDDLRDMARKYPSGSLDQTAKNFVALTMENYMGQNSQAFGKGTPQEAEAQRTLERLTDPTVIFTASDAAKLYDQLRQSTLRNADAQMRPYNFSMLPDDTGFEVE
jgi:hypothetical protein